MRWNNLGIAYLDQLQYADAMHAFEQVIRLRPDYADGHINLGLTYIEWEKYSEARPSLEKAMKMNPSGRALYYLALVERREGHRDEELADLQRVVEQYPQGRDPRRELGIAYYQRHSYEEARQQFEALQAIDPDDLAAHYNLAVLYRRLGLKDKAAEQAALFATKQVDPGRAHLLLSIFCASTPRSRPKAFRGTCIQTYRRTAPRRQVLDRNETIPPQSLASLSRTALVLPFSDLLALAQQLPGAVERSYNAKAMPAPKGPKSPIEGTPLGVSFVDVVQQSGMAVKTVYGGEGRNKYLLETTGCGLAFYDFDQDGWLDVFLVNGWRLEGFPAGQEPRCHLFKNNRDGTFTDVTKGSGLDQRTGWGRPAAWAITTTMAGMTYSSLTTARTPSIAIAAMERSRM